MTVQLHDFEGGKIWLDIEATNAERLMAGTRWEWRKVEYMRRHLKSGMTFIDAGAHYGYFTLLAAHLVGESGQVFAFEPAPDNYFDWLLPSLSQNGYRNVAPYRIALSDRRASAPLYEGQQSGHSSLYDNGHALGSRTVHIRPLDDILQDHPFEGPIDMIKIDVEGAEYDALNGMRETIRHSPHLHLLMDLHPDLGVEPDMVEGFLLQDHNFKLYSIRDEFKPIDRIPDDLVELLAVK